MSVRAWASFGIVGLGLCVALLGAGPVLGLGLGGQAIFVAPYVLFGLLAALSPSRKPGLLLSGACLAMHLALFQRSLARDAEVLGWFFGLGLIGPGLVALVAVVLLALRNGDRLTDGADRDRS